ncbi:hypothetical protein MUP00_12890, partial [Candidatus Bathyarchaeota archaeon]|nr:hypothetical protein [Candidatus Bathyarchaeota archaeon]
MERLKKIADVDNSQHPPLNAKSKQAWAKKLKGVSAIGNLDSPWSWAEFLDIAPDLELIQGGGIGYDNIDVDECTKRGIMVCNVAEVMSESVAQHAMALILDLSK